jgi:hypothetical protein
MDKTTRVVTCRHCGGSGYVEKNGTALCDRCYAMIHVGKYGRAARIEVEGTNSNEVSEVSRDLMTHVKAHGTGQSMSAWVNGSFYLVAVVSLIALLLIAGKMLSVWVLPVIIVGGLLLVTVVGALQLRQDSNLSQQNFLKLMTLAFQQLPLLGKLGRGKELPDESSGE